MKIVYCMFKFFKKIYSIVDQNFGMTCQLIIKTSPSLNIIKACLKRHLLKKQLSVHYDLPDFND